MNFSNEQIDINSLPSIIEIDYTGLDQRYLKTQIIGTSIFFLLLMIGYVLLYFFGGFAEQLTKPLIIPGIVILICGLVISLLYFSFKIKAYAVRENDVIYKKGLIFRSQTVVPFHRVQHCELDQGPLERFYGLKTLKIFTAGGSNSDLNIPGLEEVQADSLKSYIIQKSDNKAIEQNNFVDLRNEEE